MQRRFRYEQVNHRRVVALNKKKENFLNRNAKERVSENRIRGVGPDGLGDEIRVPWCRGKNGDGDDGGEFANV